MRTWHFICSTTSNGHDVNMWRLISLVILFEYVHGRLVALSDTTQFVTANYNATDVRLRYNGEEICRENFTCACFARPGTFTVMYFDANETRIEEELIQIAPPPITISGAKQHEAYSGQLQLTLHQLPENFRLCKELTLNLRLLIKRGRRFVHSVDVTPNILQRMRERAYSLHIPCIVLQQPGEYRVLLTNGTNEVAIYASHTFEVLPSETQRSQIHARMDGFYPQCNHTMTMGVTRPKCQKGSNGSFL